MDNTVPGKARTDLKKVASIVLLMVWSTATLVALDPHKTINQYGHSVWFKRNGLPVNSINVGFQGRDGYLWLGTTAGLFRFDGVDFYSVNTNLKNPNIVETISSLCMSKDSTLWIGTAYNGLFQYKNGKITVIDPTVDPTIGINSTQIRVLLESPAGNLWIGTSYGLYKYSKGKFSTVPITPSFITAIAEDSLGRIWVGTQYGVRIYDDISSSYISSMTSLNGLPQNMVNTLYCDSHGDVWIGTVDGLARWSHNSMTIYKSTDGLIENHVTTICEDRDQNLWFGTYKGLSRFYKGEWSSMTAQDGLTNDHVLSIIEDYEGSLWVCTLEGLNQFMDVNITSYTTKEGLANDDISGIAQTPDGCIYILSDVGSSVTRLKNNQASLVMASNVGTAYVAHDSSLWIGQTGLLLNIKGDRVTRYDTTKGIPLLWISAITEDEMSLIIFVNGIGIRRYIKGRLEPYLLMNGKPYTSTEYVTCLLMQPHGPLWIGTSSGLVRIQDSTSTVYSKSNGLAGDWVSSLFLDEKGSLWISSPRGGITHYLNGKLTALTINEGLFANDVYCILCDNSNNLWFSTPRGIGNINRLELDEYISGTRKNVRTHVFVTADGMKTDECFGGWQPAGWKTQDGHLWFATKKGAVMIDPQSFKRNKLPPPVLIENLIVDQQPQPLEQYLRLAPGREKLEFHYSALSFLVPERVFFRYKLEGYDRDWVDAGTRRVAYYTNLSPGDYRFRVMACNNDGVWNEAGASFPFTLEPRLYQTYWFYVVLLMIFMGIGFGVYRIRVWQLLRHEKVLKASVDEALAKIKILGGLIPICANCKKIRDDKGYWDHLEKYIQTHSEASFTHGICPDCAKKLYPEITEQMSSTSR
jgi:ligand-binding sensor domain-containing protein